MRLLIYRYLEININVADSPTIGIVSIIVTVIALMIQCGIASIEYRQIYEKSAVQIKFKILFAVSFIFAFLTTAVCIIFVTRVMMSVMTAIFQNIMGVLLSFTMHSFFTFLLTMLMVRLFVTFGQTQHAMPKPLYYMFIAITIIWPNTTCYVQATIFHSHSECDQIEVNTPLTLPVKRLKMSLWSDLRF